MSNFYSQARPLIENGKLIFVTNGDSRAIIGIGFVRRRIKELEGKNNLGPSGRRTLDLYRAGAALWDAQK